MYSNADRQTLLSSFWLPALVLLASLSPAHTQAASLGELRVLSFNIWVNGGQSLTRSIEAIRTSQADLVGLQECNPATAQTIATDLGFYYLGVNDVSILSRYPIVSTLPVSGGSGVTVQLAAGQRVHLFNCHLAPYPYGPYSIREGRSRSFVLNQEEQTRMPALNNLLNSMAPFLSGSEPCFLVGDFNAPSHLDYVDYPWPTSVVPVAAGLRDAYKEAHPAGALYPPAFAFDSPGITWTPMTGQEPNDAFDRIDFVYYSDNDGLGLVEAVELDGRNSVSPWPSDHRAVLARFSLTEPVLQDQASEPFPGQDAMTVRTDPTLSWLPGADALSHNVYFGMGAPGSFRTNQTGETYIPGELNPDTTYYWRIDEVTPSGTVTGQVWRFTTLAPHVYEWSFAGSDLSAALGSGTLTYARAQTATMTAFGLSDAVTVPHMAGQPVRFLHVPAFAEGADGYRVTLTGSAANGGGAYINQFTLLWDLLIPGPLDWTPLFNTNPENANDADFYVDAGGRLGIGAIGYSDPGVVRPGVWHRVAFAADLAASTVSYYVDGQPVFTGSASLDGRHALYSDLDAGPDLLLFNEGDGGGTYTHELYLSSFFFTDRTLSASEILALGGPKALGIAPSPLRLNAIRDGSNLRLAWTGGAPPYQLQRSWTLHPPVWENVDEATSELSAFVPLSNGGGYLRVVAGP